MDGRRLLLRRRDLLAAGAGLLAAGSCEGALSPLRRREAFGDPFGLPPSPSFPLGVSSGEVERGCARVVSRYTGTAPLELRIHEGTGPGSALLVHAVTPGDGGMLQRDLTGLSPWQRYLYAFVELDGSGAPVARSPVGQFRTPPRDDVTWPLTLTATACARQRFGFETLARAAEVDAELHLLLGDTSYNDGATTVEDFRARWLETLSREEYVQLRAATPVLATWDDHEVTNNWDAETAPADVVAAGRRAYLEHVPVRLEDPNRTGMWRRRRWGRTAEFFVMDLYSDQRPSRGEFISRAQLDWLVDGVTTSDAVFKVVMTSLPMTHMPPHFRLYEHGRWDAFPAQQREILERVDAAGTTGVLWVTGDVHMPVLGKLGLSGACHAHHEVMLGPAAHDVNPLWTTLLPPQFDYAGNYRNFTVLVLDPDGRRVTATFVDGYGTPRAARTFRA